MGHWDFGKGEENIATTGFDPQTVQSYQISMPTRLSRPSNSVLGRIALMFLGHKTLDFHTRQDSSE